MTSPNTPTRETINAHRQMFPPETFRCLERGAAVEFDHSIFPGAVLSIWFMVRDFFFRKRHFCLNTNATLRTQFYKYSRKGSHYWPCDLGVRCGFSLYTANMIGMNL
jgi:hypothetical protein